VTRLAIHRDNRLFVLARSGKRVSNGLLAVLVSVLFFILSPFACLVLVLPWEMSTPPGLTLELALTFGGSLLLVWLWLRFYERRPFRSLGFESPGWLLKVGRGFLLGAGLYTLIVVVMLAGGQIAAAPADPQRSVGLAALGGVLLVLLGWGIQGATEEIIDRGYLLQTLGARYAPWLAVITQAVLFAVMHGLNPGGLNGFALLNLFLMALTMAFFALWEGGLWGVCAFHAAWNWVQGNVFGLLVSGLQINFSLFYLRPTPGSSALLTGSAFGLEASPLTTLALGLAALAAFVLLQRKQAKGAG
jgi:uncharacterized protein